MYKYKCVCLLLDYLGHVVSANNFEIKQESVIMVFLFQRIQQLPQQWQ